LPEGAVSAAWQFQPSTELGGDVFDYFWLDAEHFGFYLLDVSGHGVGAALHSVSVFNLLRQRSLPGIDFSRPSQVMRVLNNAFPMERYGSMYFTLWYGVYHLPRQQVCFASAGHPPAIVFSAHQQHPVELFSDNPPLGMVESLLFEEKTFSLALPVRLYLYSDGVYEYTLPSGKVADKPEFVRLLMESQENAGWRPGDIFQALRMKTRAGRFDDDFSLLMLEFAG
jgi:sigma-B regulation protein RsbU (phosphoserine phosphatase)